MRPELFTFAQIHEDESPIAVLADTIENECRKYCPTAKKPKMKRHTTVIPPLWATPDEMWFVVSTLLMAGALLGDEPSKFNKAKVSGLHFFRNPGVDAMVLKLDVSKEYRDAVTFCREKMYSFSHWKFDPIGDNYDPHVTIAEGEGLYNATDPHIELFENLVQPISFHLPLWQVMIKVGVGNESRWERFDFKK